MPHKDPAERESYRKQYWSSYKDRRRAYINSQHLRRKHWKKKVLLQVAAKALIDIRCSRCQSAFPNAIGMIASADNRPYSIGRLITSGASEQRMNEEIAAAIPVCAACLWKLEGQKHRKMITPEKAIKLCAIALGARLMDRLRREGLTEVLKTEIVLKIATNLTEIYREKPKNDRRGR